MGVQKRGPNRYECYVYDKTLKRKRYVGTRKKRREAERVGFR